jgi:hypothetical protein
MESKSKLKISITIQISYRSFDFDFNSDFHFLIYFDFDFYSNIGENFDLFRLPIFDFDFDFDYQPWVQLATEHKDVHLHKRNAHASSFAIIGKWQVRLGRLVIASHRLLPKYYTGETDSVRFALPQNLLFTTSLWFVGKKRRKEQNAISSTATACRVALAV